MAEYEEALKLQKETEERVAAAMLSEGYIAELIPNVIDGLKDAGYLADEIKKDVDKNFMPWLMNEVREELTKMVSSRDILGGRYSQRRRTPCLYLIDSFRCRNHSGDPGKQSGSLPVVGRPVRGVTQGNAG